MARKTRIEEEAVRRVFRWDSILSGVVAAYLASLVCSAVLGALMLKTTIAQETVPSIISGVSFLSIAIGSGYAALRARWAGWLHGAATAALYMVTTIAISLVLFPEPLNVLAILERTVIAGLVGLGAGAISVNL
ncbi:MAG: TIGR04086 family membrane protein [Bacillota bacterium]